MQQDCHLPAGGDNTARLLLCPWKHMLRGQRKSKSWQLIIPRYQGPRILQTLSARRPLGLVLSHPLGCWSQELALLPKIGTALLGSSIFNADFSCCQDDPLPGCSLVGDDSQLRQPVAFLSAASTRETWCLVCIRSLMQNPPSLRKPLNQSLLCAWQRTKSFPTHDP